MDDRQLLALAAKAAGIERGGDRTDCGISITENGRHRSLDRWNPLTDDGDALRLAVKLNLSIRFDSCDQGLLVIVYGEWDDAPDGAQETFEKDGSAATRRAIVRTAAAIGEQT